MDIRQKIHTLLAAPNYHPLRRAEIAAKLKLTGPERHQYRRALDEMLAKGEVARVRQDRFVLAQEADLVAGTIELSEKGFAFVVPELEGTSDIYIAQEDVGVAMHGDKVLVRLHRERQQAKRSGRVIRILVRKHDTIVGTVQKTKLFYYVVPDDPRFVHDVYVKLAHNAAVGDKVVVKLAEWTSRHVNPEGEIIERLGKADAPGVDILSIIRKHNLPTEFNERTLTEAAAIPTGLTADEIARRLDLRREFIITIDPDDAKDFDDAVNVDELPGGGWRLGVHIADVCHYVRPGNALDREAHGRGNSVYLVDRVIPMLPEKLSNNLCSLRPREDRPTMSCFIEFGPKLEVRKVSFARSVIHSKHRLTYKEAFARLESPTAEDELTRELHRMWRLAAKLRAQRFAKGSLDLNFPEVKVRLDKHGRPERIEKVENDISHQLIEEFMLAANEAVARHICQAQVPGIYRIHEDPDTAKLKEYREYAKSFGYKVGDVTHRHELQKLLAAAKGKPEEYAIHLALLRSLKQAKYSPQCVGHFGLAKRFYTHFTSPIRRYADLVVHRTLLAMLDRKDGHRHSSVAELTKLSAHISLTERTAAEAEKESVELKKLEYFQQQSEAGSAAELPAVVSGVRNFGVFIELSDSLVRGLIHVSTLENDFYHFDELRERLIGRRTGQIIQIGDRLQVQVARVDVFKRQVDFRAVSFASAPQNVGIKRVDNKTLKRRF
ncbi:MAG: Ribonuclease R [Verrucomicrobiae bacterium]|nr:Ribonuclease R [Verrucomicrobiae bacterium]